MIANHAADATRAEAVSPTQPKAERVPPAWLINVFHCRSNSLLRRERCGKYVNYFDAMREDDADVREIAHLYRNILRTNEACDDRGMFRASMNAFRARVCHYLLEGGSGEKEDICEKFQHVNKYLH